MIDGFKLKISSSELRAHCTARAAYHNERGEKKKTIDLPKLLELRESLKTAHTERAETVSHMNKFSSNSGYGFNPDEEVSNLETDIKNHFNKSLVFKFFADHLFEDDYNLAEGDLIRLEIIRH